MAGKNIKERIEERLAQFDHWNALWARNFLGDLPENPLIRNSDNGIADDLVAIADKMHHTQDSEYDGPADIELPRLNKYCSEIKSAVLRQICARDLYGHAAASAREYAKQNRLDLAAPAMAS